MLLLLVQGIWDIKDKMTVLLGLQHPTWSNDLALRTVFFPELESTCHLEPRDRLDRDLKYELLSQPFSQA